MGGVEGDDNVKGDIARRDTPWGKWWKPRERATLYKGVIRWRSIVEKTERTDSMWVRT